MIPCRDCVYLEGHGVSSISDIIATGISQTTLIRDDTGGVGKGSFCQVQSGRGAKLPKECCVLDRGLSSLKSRNHIGLRKLTGIQNSQPNDFIILFSSDNTI